MLHSPPWTFTPTPRSANKHVWIVWGSWREPIHTQGVHTSSSQKDLSQPAGSSSRTSSYEKIKKDASNIPLALPEFLIQLTSVPLG